MYYLFPYSFTHPHRRARVHSLHRAHIAGQERRRQQHCSLAWTKRMHNTKTVDSPTKFIFLSFYLDPSLRSLSLHLRLFGSLPLSHSCCFASGYLLREITDFFSGKICLCFTAFYDIRAITAIHFNFSVVLMCFMIDSNFVLKLKWIRRKMVRMRKICVCFCLSAKCDFVWILTN